MMELFGAKTSPSKLFFDPGVIVPLRISSFKSCTICGACFGSAAKVNHDAFHRTIRFSIVVSLSVSSLWHEKKTHMYYRSFFKSLVHPMSVVLFSFHDKIVTENDYPVISAIMEERTRVRNIRGSKTSSVRVLPHSFSHMLAARA